MIKVLESLQKDRKDIFNLIQKEGHLTKRDIQHITSLKLTTLNRIINELQIKELIVDEAIGESTGGRKPTLYNVNLSKFYIVGIDMSRTYTQIVLTNLKMQIIKEQRISAEEEYSSDRLLDLVAQIIDSFLTEIRGSNSEIIGIGVGTVGPLDKTNSAQAIKGFLESRFTLPVIIDNGANCAVLGEYFYGSGKGHDNIAYINCGIGIRTGVITSGKIIRAINDREDAFGHMVIDIDGRECSCGNYGCVESYSSIYSIVEDVKRELKKGRLSSVKKKMNNIDYEDVFEAANEGDIVSNEVIGNSAVVFGTALSNYINLLNPQLVILSGPTVYKSEIFYRISTEVALRKINSANANIKFSKGGFFKEYSMALGAAAMVIESFI